MKVYRNAMNDPELAGLLGLFGSTEMVVPRFRHQGDITVGIDDKGAEILRVPLREPVHIRPALDAKNQLVRINCP
jgi:nitrate reductase beta subunit